LAVAVAVFVVDVDGVLDGVLGADDGQEPGELAALPVAALLPEASSGCLTTFWQWSSSKVVTR
jgi:hypothetical protein